MNKNDSEKKKKKTNILCVVNNPLWAFFKKKNTFRYKNKFQAENHYTNITK